MTWRRARTRSKIFYARGASSSIPQTSVYPTGRRCDAGSDGKNSPCSPGSAPRARLEQGRNPHPPWRSSRPLPERSSSTTKLSRISASLQSPGHSHESALDEPRECRLACSSCSLDGRPSRQCSRAHTTRCANSARRHSHPHDPSPLRAQPFITRCAPAGSRQAHAATNTWTAIIDRAAATLSPAGSPRQTSVAGGANPSRGPK
jgi:hypothetical protein